MFNWFKKNKGNKKEDEKPKISNLQSLSYHPKIILAWAKAIGRNQEFIKWLRENDYFELVMASYAIYLKDEARDWLLNNGYPHLMAMVNAAEGNEKAQKWLLQHDFEILYHIAMAVESEQSSWEWLGKNTTADIFILTQTIKKVKDEIEENHNDIHTFGKDI